MNLLCIILNFYPHHTTLCLLCSVSQVQRSCKDEEEEGGGDVLTSAHCDYELCEGLSPPQRLAAAALAAAAAAPPHALATHPRSQGKKQQSDFKFPDLTPLRSARSAPVPSAMAFTLSEIMAARRQQSQAQSHAQRGSRTTVEVDEYSTNPTQAFTFYNINQGRFQPPHVHM